MNFGLSFVNFFFRTQIFLGQYFQRMFIVGMRIRTAMVSAIYRKVIFYFLSKSTISDFIWNVILYALVSSDIEQCKERIYCRRNCKSNVCRCSEIYGSHYLPQHALVCSVTNRFGHLLSLRHFRFVYSISTLSFNFKVKL